MPDDIRAEIEQSRRQTVQTLLNQREKLLERRAEIDVLLDEVERQLDAFKVGVMIPRVPGDHTVTGRMTQRAARELREKLGQAVYEFLTKHPDQNFSRGDIEQAVIPPEHRRYWYRILQHWQKEHPDTPITHNRKPTALRRYSAPVITRIKPR